jgi:hypothetical protein
VNYRLRLKFRGTKNTGRIWTGNIRVILIKYIPKLLKDPFFMNYREPIPNQKGTH